MRFEICLRIALVFIVALAGTFASQAQPLPPGNITFLVPYAPGGSADIAARLVGVALQERLGRTVVIENRPGGSEVVATEALARSAPDGLTLAVLSNAAAINETLVPNKRYNLQTDITPVARLIEIPFSILVHPSVPANSVKELVTYAKANPQKLNYGHLGPGSPHFFVMEWFKQKAGIEMLAVPYRGAAPAVAALVAGEVQVIASGLGPATSILESGKARALAAVSSKRPVSRPDLPTLAEVGYPEFDLNSWMGVFARAGTPQPVILKLQDEILAALSDPIVAEKLTKIGLEPIPQRAVEFGEFVKASVTSWERIVKATGAKAE